MKSLLYYLLKKPNEDDHHQTVLDLLDDVQRDLKGSSSCRRLISILMAYPLWPMVSYISPVRCGQGLPPALESLICGKMSSASKQGIELKDFTTCQPIWKFWGCWSRSRGCLIDPHRWRKIPSGHAWSQLCGKKSPISSGFPGSISPDPAHQVVA